MAEVYRRNPYSTLQSLADIENLESLYTLSEQDIEEQIKSYRRKIKHLAEIIKQQRKDLKNYVEKHDLPENLPVFDQVMADPVVPDTSPESYLDYRSIEQDRYKVFVDESYAEIQRIMKRESSTIEEGLRDRADVIMKLKLQKSWFEQRLEKAMNLHGESLRKRKENFSRYNELMDQYYRSQEIISSINTIIDLFDDYPDDFTSDDAVKIQDRTIDKFCVYYKQRRNNLAEDMADFATDFPDTMNLEGGQDPATASAMLLNEKIFPDQYIQAIDKKAEILKALNTIKDVFKSIKDNASSELDKLAGKKGIKNTVLENYIKRSKQIITSPVKEANTDQINQQQLQEDNLSYLQKAQRKVTLIKSEFERYGEQAADRIDANIARIMSLSFLFPKKNTKTSRENLEDRYRDEIRNKYGGDIGFCDEVKGEGPNGLMVWMKRSEAVQVKPGVWRDKTLEESNKYEQNHSENKSDVF